MRKVATPDSSQLTTLLLLFTCRTIASKSMLVYNNDALYLYSSCHFQSTFISTNSVQLRHLITHDLKQVIFLQLLRSLKMRLGEINGSSNMTYLGNFRYQTCHRVPGGQKLYFSEDF